MLINQNAPDEETRDRQLGRSADIFGSDMESLEERGGATNKAEDLQTGIDEEATRLEEYYASDLERIQMHEEAKRDIINEATNLTWEKKKELILKLEADTAAKEKQIFSDNLNTKLDATRQFLGGMGALAGAFGKKGFKAQQAFAIAEATVNTFQSATKAMATIPPPFNYIAAAGSIAFGLAQVAQIKSQQPPAYQQGGIVGGSSYGGDQINARLNSGEMVLNKTQQSNLFDQANNPIGGDKRKGSVTIINQTGSDISGEFEEKDDGNLEIVIQKAVKQAKDELTNEANYGGGSFIPSLEKNYGLARN